MVKHRYRMGSSTHSPKQAESEGDCDAVVVDMEHPTSTSSLLSATSQCGITGVCQ